MFSNLTRNDYASMAGPDWPTYDDFINGNRPTSVVSEIESMLRQYKEKIDSISPTFCVLPYYGKVYPGNSACCLMPPGTNLNEVRSEMRDGRRPIACQKCWVLEDLGMPSNRHSRNMLLSVRLNKDISELFESAVHNKSKVVHYNIATNNTCNAACATCDSSSSSTWAGYEKQANLIPATHWEIDADDINIDYKNAACISFHGGEPTLSKTNFDILQNLIDANNTNCLISFVTNGSTVLSKKQLGVLTKFSDVNFCFSVDGIGPVFDYMRYPIRWNTVVANMKQMHSLGFTIGVNYTVSNLNILYYAQTIEWFEQNSLIYQVNPVYRPRYFRPLALSKTVKQMILNTTDSEFVHNTLGTHSDADDADYLSFLKNISNQDKWKKINGRDYLPEFFDMVVTAGLEPATNTL